MKFRLGLIIGLITGFIIGARSGRERYDQIMAGLHKVRGNPQVKQAADLAERSTRKTRAAAGNTLVGTAGTIRERAAR